MHIHSSSFYRFSLALVGVPVAGRFAPFFGVASFRMKFDSLPYLALVGVTFLFRVGACFFGEGLADAISRSADGSGSPTELPDWPMRMPES